MQGAGCGVQGAGRRAQGAGFTEVHGHTMENPRENVALDHRARPHLLFHGKRIELKLFDDEVDYTACSLLVISKNSCNTLHRQKVLI